MGNESSEIQNRGELTASGERIDGLQNSAPADDSAARQVSAPQPQPAAPALSASSAADGSDNTGSIPAATQATPSDTASADASTSVDTPPSNTQGADVEPDAGQSTDPRQPDDASSPPPSLDCRFCGLDGEPIAGAKYRFIIDSNEISGTTDGGGNAQTLSNLKPEADCVVYIQRDDGTFKQIGTFVVPATGGYVTLMSPSALLEGQSEQHGGNEADVHKEPDSTGDDNATAPASTSGGATSDADSRGAGSTDTSSGDAKTRQGTPAADSSSVQPPSSSSGPAPAAPAASPSPRPKPQSAPAPVAASASSTTPAKKPPQSVATGAVLNGGTGKAPQAKAVQSARDALSHPQAKPNHDSTDWLDQKIMATWHYIEDLFGVKSNPVMAANRGAPSGAAPKPAAANQPGAAAPGSVRPYTALMQVAEEQTAHHLPSAHTVDNLSQLSKGTFKYGADKPASQSLGDCYLYVKVALWRAKYVNSALPGVYAKVAGPFLVQAGFKDVTGEMPDARWALPGDVIVYKLHGDPDPTADNKKPAGHIDIRTYHHYISDFRRNHLFFHGHGTYYEVSGIYRKPDHSDPSVTARVQAFLKVIRSREATTLFEHYGDKATYGAVYGAVKPEDGIKDFSTHPFANKDVDHSPAGAYQITKRTWASGWKDNGMPNDFSPATQDRYAVWIMEMQWEKSSDQSSQTALGYVRLGDLDNAVRLLKSQWASLPGTGQSRGYTMDQLKADFNKFLKEYS